VGQPNEDPQAIEATLKKAAAVLRDAGVDFMLAGGMAAWARGGPESGHDLDFALRPEDAERALDALEAAGFRGERPPEAWLYKAWDDNDVMVDLIFRPVGRPVTDDIVARAEEREVNAVRMRVMAADDILTTKLLALTEHSLDYEGCLEIARALREQLDWDTVRARTTESPFAKAFFTLAQELGVAPQAA
jgi:hypothetical protein